MNNVIVFFIGVSFLLLGTFRYTEIIVLSGRFLWDLQLPLFSLLLPIFLIIKSKKWKAEDLFFIHSK